MGVGSRKHSRAVFHGIDMFDCVLPTRGREDRIVVYNKERCYKKRPVTGKMRHHWTYFATAIPVRTIPGIPEALFVAKEILAMVLNTIHNVRFYMNLMERIRTAIQEDRFVEFRREFLDRYVQERKKILVRPAAGEAE